MTTTYEFHPFCKKFPRVAETIAELIADLEANGYQGDPIWIYQGKILDGRHLFLALKKLGIKPVIKHFHGTEDEAFDFVLRRNLHRRQLTEAQRAALIAWGANRQRIKAKKDHQANVEKAKKNGTKPPPAPDYERIVEESYEAKKKEAPGVNDHFGRRSVAVGMKDNKILSEVTKGKLSIPAAEEIVDASPAQRKAFKEAIAAKNEQAAKKILQDIRYERRHKAEEITRERTLLKSRIMKTGKAWVEDKSLSPEVRKAFRALVEFEKVYGVS